MRITNIYKIMQHKESYIINANPKLTFRKHSILDIRVWYQKVSTIPILLVNVSRQQGLATQRNLFKRRVRTAFFLFLKKQNNYKLPIIDQSSYLIWIRPIRSIINVQLIPFRAIINQIELALRHWEI